MADTKKIDTTGWKAYILEIRKHVPEGYEIAFHASGLSYTSQAYIFACFVNDISAKECAARMTAKFRVVQKDEQALETEPSQEAKG